MLLLSDETVETRLIGVVVVVRGNCRDKDDWCCCCCQRYETVETRMIGVVVVVRGMKL